ncbi:MAG: glycosyltransferase family 4 protein [candidate division FCPU426 bacterium]
MRVCLISASYPPVRCGVGDQVYLQAERLSAAGESVQVLTSASVAAPPAAQVELLPLQLDWNAARTLELAAHVRRLAPEVVHLHYPALGYGLGLAPNLLFPALELTGFRGRRVATLHEYRQFTWKGKARLWPTLRFAHRLICTNRLDQKALENDFPSCREKIQIIPLGNPLEAETPEAATGPAATDLVHFGTIMPNKGWEDLLLALARLKGQGRPQRLLAVTALEPEAYAYHRIVKQRIQALGLEAEVVFTGYLPAAEAGAALRSGRIAVQPYSEGARLNRSSLVAVLAHGLAVISTDPPLALEELTANRHFWAVRPRDPVDLAQGILHLLDHPELTASLRREALEVSRAYFSWERIISLTRGMYRQILASC